LTGQYSHFESKSKNLDYGVLNVGGFALGGEVDLVQYEKWMYLGISAERHFMQPFFRGSYAAPSYVLDTRTKVDVIGSRYSTIGVYARYVPPEILNWPLHVELYYRRPLEGPRLTDYGVAFAFRPQIYRFDATFKFIAESRFLQGNQIDDGSPTPKQWDMQLEWTIYGAEAGVYF
jgi:hypothetical protein